MPPGLVRLVRIVSDQKTEQALNMYKQGGMLLASMLLATMAMAQNKVDTGIYAGLDGAYATPSNGTNLPPGFHTTSHSTAVGVWRLLLGYQFNNNLGVELAYLRTGDFRQSASNGVVNYNARISAKGEDLALVYRFSELAPAWFIKAGVSRTELTTAVQTVAPGRTAMTSLVSNGTGYLAGLGYHRNITEAVAAQLAYTRYVGIGGQNNIKLNVFSAGLIYRF